MEKFIHDKYTLKAVELVRKGQSFFITGKAGTGKTMLLKKIVQECRARGKNIAVTAPTGIAAKNANGKTLHSMFGLKTFVFIPGMTRKWYTLDSAREKIIKNIDILIIDEISMVRCDVLDMVDHTLRRIKGKRKPFGGIQVVFFGDLFQLPPVVTDREKELLYSYYEKDNPYFFSSDVIKKKPFPVLELATVYRQPDEQFVGILNNIREGNYLPSDRETLNKRYSPGFEPTEKDTSIYLRTVNWKVDAHNSRKLKHIKGEPETFWAEIKDDFPENLYPVDNPLKLKVGAKVMLLRNDNDNYKFVNGTQGVISSIYNGVIRVKTIDGDLISVVQSTWELYDYIFNEETKTIDPIEIGSFKQYPIKLAWAVTIHKSQGMTFDKAIIDARHSFAPGQVYVALSRCRSLKGLTLTSRITEEDIKVDPLVVSYMKTVERIIPEEVDVNAEVKERSMFIFADNGKTIKSISSEAYGNIEIPEGVEIIAEEAFKDNTNITGVTCPNSLREIGDNAFSGCRNLYTISLNEGIRSIGLEAFIDTGLGEIDIPSTLEEIGFTAFECSMNVHVLNPNFSDTDGVLYDREQECLILYPRKHHDSVIELPDTITCISSYAFEGCHAKEIIIPDGIEKLEGNIFNECQNLKTLTLKSDYPDIIEIDEAALSGFEVEKCVLRVPFDALSDYLNDERLNDFKYVTVIEGSRCLMYNSNGTEVAGCDEEECENIEIPEGVTSIKDNAFEGNEKIESVILPESLESIGNSAFYGCGSLEEIELKDGLTSIGWDAFRGTALTHIIIPYTVQDIGFSAFGCKMEVDSINTDYCDIDGTLYSFDETELIIYPSNKTEESFEISESVTAIESYAFEDSCLKSLFIPSTIERIGGYILSGSSDLKELIFNIKDPRDISRDKNMFDGFNKSACKLIIPKGCRRKYSSIKQFQGFLSIEEMDSKEEDIIEEYREEETKFVTGQFFERLPSYQLKESKVFCYIYSKWRCSIVSTQDGFFLNILHGGYYFLSKHVSQFKHGAIWVQNKRDTLSSYDFSFSPDNKTNILVGHFTEGRINGTLTYRDLTTGQSFTINFEKG